MNRNILYMIYIYIYMYVYMYIYYFFDKYFLPGSEFSSPDLFPPFVPRKAKQETAGLAAPGASRGPGERRQRRLGGKS